MPGEFLEARNLRKRYGAITALDGVSLAIGRGELFGLLGPNGAGKTTLLSILAGLLDADEGCVTLDGTAVIRRDLNVRRRIGLGTQDLAVYPELTARENLQFFGKLYDLAPDRLTKRIDTLLDAVGLSDRADDRAGTFSGGMKRRLNLAVAVVHEPDVLFLDEPTTGVDPQSRNHIYDLVRSLNSSGTTIVYTSHYLEEVESLCKRIAIIDRGKVLACSTLTELLKMLSARIVLQGVPPGEQLLEAFRALPGVRQAEAVDGGVEIAADAAGPLLPRLCEVWLKHAVAPAALRVDEPSLEKVFLHLTGHALRD